MVGRPLWERELSKEVPAPNAYDIKRNIELEPLSDRRSCQFGANFQSYRKTMDISKDVRIYETNSLNVSPPYTLPNVDMVKRKHPSITVGRAP
jgi:hypothetical protein